MREKKFMTSSILSAIFGRLGKPELEIPELEKPELKNPSYDHYDVTNSKL